MTTAIVIGHSFVSGLEHHFRNLNHGYSMFPDQIADELRISDRVARVILSGVPGAQICTFASTLPHFLLRQERPDLAILQVGTNDLAAGRCPAWVATETLNQAQTLLDVYNVQHVTICSALFRERGVVEGLNFRHTILEYNDRLFFACRGQQAIDYHSHDGFWTTPVSVWSRDGIHPNSYRGRVLYKKSLRQALFKGFATAFTPLQ